MVAWLKSMLNRRADTSPPRVVDAERDFDLASDKKIHRSRINRADSVIRDGMAQADLAFNKPYGGADRRRH